MKIIALGHRSRMGKDTFATFIATQLRLKRNRINVKIVGFADPLKDTCTQLYGWAGVQRKEYYEEHPEARDIVLLDLGFTVVDLWIKVGMMMRAVYQDTWVNSLYHEHRKVDVLVIKDLRFENEVQSVIDRKGLLVKIHNPRTPYRSSPADEPLEAYKSWNTTIVNDGDLPALHEKAKGFIKLWEL